MSLGGPERPLRDALDFGPRPDPAVGIVETIRIHIGELVALDAHRERMQASARELYGLTVNLGFRRYGDGDHGRVRVTLTPDGTVRIEDTAIGPDPIYTGIAPFVLPGGLGPHKWLDRRLVDAVSTAADGALPLLIDADASVLEATWANVLIEERGRLISPPADGRALPGIGRRALRYDEEPVDLDRLLAADAVVLSSALRVIRIPRKAASGR
jgi:para-aminobenzoate synthetase/4-amino-4-deoxychorismate lyase